MFNSLSRDAKFRIYLLILSAVGLVLILLTTSKYGAGVSSDAARNLSTADSLLAGKGFVDMLGRAVHSLAPAISSGVGWPQSDYQMEHLPIGVVSQCSTLCPEYLALRLAALSHL